MKVGDDLVFNGVCLYVDGKFVVGDIFNVVLVISCDIFSILDSLIGLLKMDIGSVSQFVVQQNLLQSGLCDIV